MIRMILSLLVLAGFALSADYTNWNKLTVTWSLNPLKSFKDLPRTEWHARQAGWKKNGDCTGGNFYRGMRYIKGNDVGIMLLYDVRGFIAGIQAGIPTGAFPNFPKKGDKFYNTYNYDKKTKSMVQTAYFVPPENICKKGRSYAQYKDRGTGSCLFLQQGKDPVKNSIAIPATEKELKKSKLKISEGGCFWSMGHHYWFDTSKNMKCSQFYPVFLFYNGGDLTGFGWAFQIKHNSGRYESWGKFGSRFFKGAPKCLKDFEDVSMIHIYLEGRPILKYC